METVFRSPRLLYRAIEDTPTDTTFLHSLQTDAAAFALSNSDLLRPPSLKSSREYRDELASKMLLGVIICLAPPYDDDSAPSDAVEVPVPVGCLTLTALKREQVVHRHTYVGIDIAKGYRGRGFGTEAINWAVDWAFRIAGMHRVGIEAGSYNVGAARLYERMGFVWEGRQRGIYWFNGGWHDLITFGMLEDEWRELRKQGKGVNELAT